MYNSHENQRYIYMEAIHAFLNSHAYMHLPILWTTSFVLAVMGDRALYIAIGD